MSRSPERRDPWWIPFTIGLLLLGIGVGVLFEGAQAAAQHRALAERGVVVDAVITALGRNPRHPAVDLVWTTTTGRTAQVQGAEVDGRVSVGEHVVVVYDRDDPGDVVVGQLGGGYLAVLWLGGLVALAGAAAVLRGLWLRRGDARRRGAGDPP